MRTDGIQVGDRVRWNLKGKNRFWWSGRVLAIVGEYAKVHFKTTRGATRIEHTRLQDLVKMDEA